MTFRVSEVDRKERDKRYRAAIKASKTTAEAAKKLDVSVRTLQRWAQQQWRKES